MSSRSSYRRLIKGRFCTETAKMLFSVLQSLSGPGAFGRQTTQEQMTRGTTQLQHLLAEGSGSSLGGELR